MRKIATPTLPLGHSPAEGRRSHPRPHLAFADGAGVTSARGALAASLAFHPSLMASGTSGDRAVRLVLSLVIVALAAALVYVIVVPAQKAAEAQALTALSRQRLSDLRTALTSYREQEAAYPSTLDSLALFARTDSTLQARIAAEEERAGGAFVLDSIFVSPRSGRRFQYAVVEDTSGTEIYWLGDPDVPGDSIGARDPNPAYRNAASWE